MSPPIFGTVSLCRWVTLTIVSFFLTRHLLSCILPCGLVLVNEISVPSRRPASLSEAGWAFESLEGRPDDSYAFYTGHVRDLRL